jgi:hypothetical protein
MYTRSAGNNKIPPHANKIVNRPTKYFSHPNMNTQKFFSPYDITLLRRKDHMKSTNLYKITRKPMPGEIDKPKEVKVIQDEKTGKTKYLNYLPHGLEKNVNINTIYNVRYGPRKDMMLVGL